MSGGSILVDIQFEAPVIHWRGPSPFFFIAIPDVHIGELKHAARDVTYGWGMIPVEAVIGDTRFTTSLFPREGGYLLPLKDKVRDDADLGLGGTATVRIFLHAKRHQG